MMGPGQVNKKQRDASRQEAKNESKEVTTIAKPSASDVDGDVKLEAKRRKSTVDVESKDEVGEDYSTTTSTSEEGATIEHAYKDCAHISPSAALTLPPRNKSQENIPIRYRRLPSKLNAMLSSPEYEAIISWLPHGRSWKVHDPQAFIEHIIPAFFDYQNFNSFIRLVNAWGFRRLMKGPDRNSYYHELFLRGKPYLHERMRRLGTKEKKNVAAEPNLADFQPCPPLVRTAPEFASLSAGLGPQSRSSGGDTMHATEILIRPELLPGQFSSGSTLQRPPFLPVSNFLAGSRRSPSAASSAGARPEVWDSHSLQYPGLPLPSPVSLPPAQPLDQFSLPVGVRGRRLLTQEERIVLLARNTLYGANTGSGSSLSEENRLSLLAAPMSAAFSSLRRHQEIADVSSLLALQQAQQVQVGMLASQQRQQLLWDRALEDLVSQERAIVRQQQLHQQQQQQRRDQLTIASAAARLVEEGRYEAPSHNRSWLPLLGPPPVQENTSRVPYLDPSSDTSQVGWATGSTETLASLISRDEKPASSGKASHK